MTVYNNKEKREGNLIIVDDHFEVESEGYFTTIYRTIDSLHNSGWELVWYNINRKDNVWLKNKLKLI